MKSNNKENQLSLYQEGENHLEILGISSLGIFQRCPLEYKYRFLPRNKEFDPQGYAIILGRILHSITADYLSKTVKERNIKSNLQDNKVKLEKYFDSSNKKYYDIAMKALNQLINGPLSKLSVKAIEYSFKKQVESFLLKGRIDCIGRKGKRDLIIDFKINPSELDHHKDQCSRYLQLIFYYIGIKDSIILNSPYLAYYFYSNASFEMIEVSESIVRNGLDRIIRLDKQRREATEYPPQNSYYCSTCTVRSKGLCPIWKK